MKKEMNSLKLNPEITPINKNKLNDIIFILELLSRMDIPNPELLRRILDFN